MVLTSASKRLIPALVVPDEQTWTALGADPGDLGLRPSFDPGAVRRVLAPRELPTRIAEALTEYRSVLGEDVPIEYVDLPGAEDAVIYEELRPAGQSQDETASHDHGHGEHAQAEHERARHGHGDSHAAGHHGHGHHDMMAIVGEPSADGLVMEPIRLSYGPLGTPLPGGLVVDVALDGDVVAESDVRSVIGADTATKLPDLLSPVAWALATDRGGTASTNPWLRVAAIEIERAVSHLAWLRSLGRLLEFQPLVVRCSGVLGALLISRCVLPGREVTKPWLHAAVGQGDLDGCRELLEELVGWLNRSRSLHWRLSGRAVISPARAHELALRGPVARASAIGEDARTADPLYADLDFAPVVSSGGDALARTRVRGEEALDAVRLAIDALALDYVGADAPRAKAGAPVIIEGPRGPISTLALSAVPPAPATRRAAADAMIGSEWAAALVGLVSFDLSPWRDSS